MEQFILGLFKEQLSKFIIGFNQDKINANLLNGKGEITDLELNCALLNQELLKITPYAQLDRVHLSRLSFHVDSWTNLRKAPIHVDVGHITAQLSEPFHFVDEEERDIVRQVTMTELMELIRNGAVPKLRTTSYNLLDRIIDNLFVEIKSLSITFQPVGKFKTRCQGPWTPPAVRIQLNHLKWVVVNEFGQEDTPDNVWRHNHDRRRSKNSSFFIYKKFECQYRVSLVETVAKDEKVTPLVSCKSDKSQRGNRMEMQVAMKRRIRDGEYLAVQVDVSIPLLDVEIQATSVPLLAHFAAAMQYCMAKDRSFVDPLKSSAGSMASGEKVVARKKSERSLGEATESIEVTAPALVSLADSFSEGSNDEVDFDSAGANQEETRSSLGPQAERPLLVTPTGMVFHEKVSFSLSIQNLETRCIYQDGDNCQATLIANGLVVEGIWPKITNEKGGYLQTSVSFLSVQDFHAQRTRQLLAGGSRFDRSGPIEVTPQPLAEVRRDESFPLFEDRSVRPDPLQLRHTFPMQAFGCKATVGLEEKEHKHEYVVLFEALLDHFTITLESKAWVRFLRFLSNCRNGGFDKRWHTGDWTDLLTMEMLLRPSEPLVLDDHLQHVVPTFLDENDLPSSEFLNANVKVRDVILRLPAAIHEDPRSCDIILQLDQSTLVISSSLPVHLMENNSRADNVQFPHCKSDQVHSSAPRNDTTYSSAISTIFRVQCSCSGLSVQLSPALGFTDENILLPCSIDMAVGFEGSVQSDDPECDSIQLCLIVSMISPELQIRVNVDRLFSAFCTMKAHADICMGFVEELLAVYNEESAIIENNIGMPENTLDGRRILVQRQIVRGRQSSGLHVAVWFVVDSFAVSMWRRNVPRTNPLKPAQSATNEIMPELCLLECFVHGVDLGVEYTGLQTQTKILTRFSANKFDFKVAEFADMLANDELWRKTFLPSPDQDFKSHSEYMFSLFRFGPGKEAKLPAMSFRCQCELTGKFKAVSASFEIESGTVNVAPENTAVTFLLTAEALVSLAKIVATTGFALLSRDGPLSQVLSSSVNQANEGETKSSSMLTNGLESFDGFILGRFRIRDTNLQVGPSKESGGYGFSFLVEECGALLKFDKTTEAKVETDTLIHGVATLENESWSDIISKEDKDGNLVLCCRCCSMLKNLTENINILEMPMLKSTFDGVEADIVFHDGVRIRSAKHLNQFMNQAKAISNDSMAVASQLLAALSTLFLSLKKEKHDDHCSENPVNLACRSALASIQSVKQWLQTVNHTMSISATIIKEMLEKKQLELNTMQLLIFEKEKERLSSLARNEPDMTGWLKVGAARRTGQRGLLSGTLWPHWAVLRKSILFLFMDPSDSSPSELIPLDSASIHPLLGGQRRRDLTRSAAIVDKCNNIHFIVADSELELESWYQKIRQAISIATTETIPTIMESDQHALPTESCSNGVSVEENGHGPRKLPSSAESLPVTTSNVGISREPAKSRLTSVLSAARQKGKEVAERTKQRLAAPTDARSRAASVDSSNPQCWTCEACTYAYNNTGTTTCEMCGTSSKGNRSRNSSIDSDTLPMDGASGDEKGNLSTTAEMMDNRPALRQRFGAAVRLARSKGKALATNISREVTSDAEAKGEQLRNVMLASSSEHTVIDNVTLHSLEATWKFSVRCKGFDAKKDITLAEPSEDQDKTEILTFLTFDVQSTRLLADDPDPIDTTVTLTEILQLHRMISEKISKVPLSAYVSSQDSQRRMEVHMSERTEALLGISAIDLLRSTARTIGGMIVHASRPETWPYLSSLMEDFFEALSGCPLPLDCLTLFTDTLHLPFSAVVMEKGAPKTTRFVDDSSPPQHWHASLTDVSELSSLCEVELLRAENQSRLAEELTQAKPSIAEPASMIPIQQSKAETTFQINEATRATLIRVMEERDEAQARCISRDVLHSHELAQERRRNALMETKLAKLLKISEESNMFSSDKDRREFQALRRQDRQQQQESDAELLSLCQQLSNEIAARTQADMEVARLKDIRKLEIENDAQEKQALYDEIARLRQQVDREKQRSALLRKESGTWRESFEDAVRIKDSLPPPPPPRKLPPNFDRQSRSFDR